MRRLQRRVLNSFHALWLLSACLAATRVLAEPPIGYAAVHGRALDSHVSLLLDGSRAFEAGAYGRAAELYGQLAKTTPGYLEPLYNRACALIKLGQLPGAYALLREVLRTDLAGYERLYRTDDDLKVLRASSYGQRLSAEIERIRAEVKRALRAGVPAVRYALHMRGEERVRNALRFQAGVYLHTVRRFVPLAAEVQGDDAGSQLVSVRDGVAFGVSAEQGRLAVLASPAPTDLENQVSQLNSSHGELEVAPTRGGAAWRFLEPWDVGDRSVLALERDGHLAPWSYVATRAGQAPRPVPVGAGPRLRVSQRGGVLTYERPGDVVSGRTMRSQGRSVLLSVHHEHAQLQWIVPTDAGRPGLVISLLRCRPGNSGCDRFGYGHAIDVISTSSSSGRPWLHGAGTAMASFERTGAVYVQLSSTANWSTLRRYRRAGDQDFESIMPNVLLVAAPPGGEPRKAETLPLSSPDALQADPFALEPKRPAYGPSESTR